MIFIILTIKLAAHQLPQKKSKYQYKYFHFSDDKRKISIIFFYILLLNSIATAEAVSSSTMWMVQHYFHLLSLTHSFRRLWTLKQASCLKSFRLLHWMRLTFTKYVIFVSLFFSDSAHSLQAMTAANNSVYYHQVYCEERKVKWSICELLPRDMTQILT